MAVLHAEVVSEVSLRRASADDVAVIVAMLADDEIGAARESPGDLAPYRRAFDAIDADPSELLVVAERGGQVVGTVQVSWLPGLSRHGALRAQLEGVRVARAARGSGVGEAMMGWVIERARSRGCALVQLTTDKTRTDAHRFYDRLGFTATHQGYKLPLQGPTACTSALPVTATTGPLLIAQDDGRDGGMLWW